MRESHRASPHIHPQNLRSHPQVGQARCCQSGATRAGERGSSSCDESGPLTPHSNSNSATPTGQAGMCGSRSSLVVASAASSGQSQLTFCRAAPLSRRLLSVHGFAVAPSSPPGENSGVRRTRTILQKFEIFGTNSEANIVCRVWSVPRTERWASIQKTLIGAGRETARESRGPRTLSNDNPHGMWRRVAGDRRARPWKQPRLAATK